MLLVDAVAVCEERRVDRGVAAEFIDRTQQRPQQLGELKGLGLVERLRGRELVEAFGIGIREIVREIGDGEVRVGDEPAAEPEEAAASGAPRALGADPSRVSMARCLAPTGCSSRSS